MNSKIENSKLGKRIKFGIVGAVGRGRAYRTGIEVAGGEIVAVCDIQADKLNQAAQTLGASAAFTDYTQMLDKGGIDAVVVATPMFLHAEQAIAALARNIHTFSEVPAVVSVAEARRLVAAAHQSKAIYMMGENFCYMRHPAMMIHLAVTGKFGKIYYAEGEYLHELKELNEITPWRRKWQTGLPGVTYGTHSLGPILQCLPGDRVVKVCGMDTDLRYKDPRGDEYAQTTPVMLCKTAAGVLIKIRSDMVSDRPHAMSNYQIQGTDGVYESGRNDDFGRGQLWLRELSEKIQWIGEESLWTIDSLRDRYVPEIWRTPSPEASLAGHGGGDYFEVKDFIDAIHGKGKPCPIDVHRAMDMTLPGLISQDSVRQNGVWLEVPDSRDWVK
jgi:predicted dehydrogenase